jgi:uncharacterized membrane protein
MLKIVDNVVDASKSPTRGVNIADRFVDSTISIAAGISGKIKAGGKVLGSDF